jgi:hypothetical protein
MLRRFIIVLRVLLSFYVSIPSAFISLPFSSSSLAAAASSPVLAVTTHLWSAQLADGNLR